MNTIEHIIYIVYVYHMWKYKGYEIFVSDKPNKKYYATVGGRKMYFGDSNYSHYRDKLGHWSHLDHLDVERRRRYKARHEKNRHNKPSPGWFADQILW